MLTPTLTLLFAAAPVEVIATPGDSSGAVSTTLRRALPDATVVDGTGLYVFLGDPNTLLGQDFDAFTAPPHPSWPPALAATWTAAVGHCRDLVGPPPWKTNMATAVVCGLRLSLFLWQRFVEHHAARAVTVLSASQLREKNSVRVSGHTWRPSQSTAITADEVVPEGELAVMLERVASALVARVGATRPREVIGAFSTDAPPGVDLLADEAVATARVDAVSTCQALPSSLTFSADSVLAKSLAGRWRSSVTGRGPDASCSITLSQSEQDSSFMGPLSVTAAVVKCADVTVGAEAADHAASKRSLADLLSTGLVKALAERWCRPPPTPKKTDIFLKRRPSFP